MSPVMALTEDVYSTDASWDGYGVNYPLPIPNLMRWCSRVAPALAHELGAHLKLMDAERAWPQEFQLHSEGLPCNDVATCIETMQAKNSDFATYIEAAAAIAKLFRTWHVVSFGLPVRLRQFDLKLRVGVDERGQATDPEFEFFYSTFSPKSAMGWGHSFVGRSIFSFALASGETKRLDHARINEGRSSSRSRRRELRGPTRPVLKALQVKPTEPIPSALMASSFPRADFWPPDRSKRWLRSEGVKASRCPSMPFGEPQFVEISAPPLRRLRSLAHNLAKTALLQTLAADYPELVDGVGVVTLDLSLRTTDLALWRTPSAWITMQDLLSIYWRWMDSLRDRNARSGHGWLLPVSAKLCIRFVGDCLWARQFTVDLVFANGSRITREITWE